MHPFDDSRVIFVLAMFVSDTSMASALNFGCPSTQRYDVAEFPPRCLDCPHVIPKPMDLSLIGAAVRARRTPSKFSPGLPQNATCGCWRAPVDQVVEMTLNASWVVSGIVFGNLTRTRWLREIQVNASDDNITFIDWGAYTARNHTDSALTVFALPIRARYFRISVLRYVNHRVNESGFPLTVSALVSKTEPFGCGCPMLSSGRCCPFVNMTIRNDTCVWCMDPSQITTVMVNGCGKCRQGTSEHEGRCVLNRRINTNNRLEVDALFPEDGTSSIWLAHINVTVEDPRTAVILFLTQDPTFVHPCVGSSDASCLVLSSEDNSNTDIITIAEQARYTSNSTVIQRLGVPDTSSQYLQFDRGRFMLNMTLEVLRSWALCTDTVCTGAVGALFLTLFDDGISFRAQAQIQPLHFRLTLSNLLLTSTAPSQVYGMGRMELHTFPTATGSSQWAIRVIGVRLRGSHVYVQWDTLPPQFYTHTLDDSNRFIAIDTPPANWTTLRLTDGPLNITTLAIQQPITVVHHTTQSQWHGSDITIRIRHGFDFNTAPQPGDSEQIVFITATSQRPVRLKRLSVTTPTATTTYTTPKGFVKDPTKALDLGIACASPKSDLAQWVYRAAVLLQDNDPRVAAFARASCVQAASVTKAYWMVVPNDGEGRTKPRPMKVEVEFI